MNRKVKEILDLILTTLLFGILAYVAAAVALGSLVIYNSIMLPK